jgi:hypothetical protein
MIVNLQDYPVHLKKTKEGCLWIINMLFINREK